MAARASARGGGGKPPAAKAPGGPEARAPKALAAKAPGARRDPSLAIDRRAVLDAASRLLVDEGPAALTMRRLAAEVGASTMVLYSRFEGREALIALLLEEGFARFADALGAVDHPDPWENLRLLGHAYRRFALDHPRYFRLMWGGAHGARKEASPPPLDGHGRRAFGSLLIAVTRILAALDRSAREAEPLALSIWSTVHGFVCLELAGACGPVEHTTAAYEGTLAFLLAALGAPASRPRRTK
jgi:AcrR family transcriptional regulator